MRRPSARVFSILAVFALVAAAGITPALAQPTPPPIKLQPPLLMGPGMPMDDYLAYLEVESAVNKLLRQPCVTPARQKWALDWAEQEIVWLLKYGKSSGPPKVDEQEANDYASILNAKYLELKNKKVCPPGAGGTTTPGTPGVTGGGSSGTSGTGTTTGTTPGTTTAPKPCTKAEKVKAARKDYSDASTAIARATEALVELQKALAAAEKIVRDFDAASGNPSSLKEYQDNVEKMRAVNDARRDIGDLKAQIEKANKDYSDAAKVQGAAGEELNKLGADPFEDCDPKDSFMMLPGKSPELFADANVPVGGEPVSFDTVALASSVVSDPVAVGTACCEPLVQRLILTTKGSVPLPPAPKPKMALLPLVREWWTALTGPARDSQLAARGPFVAARAVPEELWLAPIDQSIGHEGGPRIEVVITSLGTSQGESFQLQIINDQAKPMRLLADGVVVEPLKRSARDEARKRIETLAPRLKRATTVNVEGYCLNVGLLPPDAGAVFRVASPEVQEQFAAARRVLRAASTLSASGTLKPDTDAQTYLESIKQYAVWAKLERWNQQRFSDVWVDNTHKQIVALKRRWTSEMEATLRAAVPGRWRDIQLIFGAAQ